MSLLRSFGKAMFGFLFTVSIVLTITVSSMINFTSFESVQSIVDEIFDEVAGGQVPTEEEFDSLLETIKTSCRETGSGSFDFDFEGEIDSISTSCDDIEAIDTGGDVSETISSTVAESIYYKEYDCGFLECIQRGDPMFPLAFTKIANDFYKEALTYVIIVTLMFGALLVIAARGLDDKLRSVGASILWASVPFLVMSFLVGFIAGFFVSPEVVDLAKPVIDNLLAPDFMIYVYLVIIGAALTAAGYYVGYSTKKKDDDDD